MKLEGVARHSSVHAAAVIVADRELTHYTPLMRGNKNTITSTITQYEFPILESIGLLKVDFLGLSTLSVMREAARLINERHGTDVQSDQHSLRGRRSDRRRSSCCPAARWPACSRWKARACAACSRRCSPAHSSTSSPPSRSTAPARWSTFRSSSTACTARRRCEFKHPALEPILAETYGIIVYQEQIIQILSQLAGYTPGEADLVRRAVGKKKASDIEKHKKTFVEGCENNGIEKQDGRRDLRRH